MSYATVQDFKNRFATDDEVLALFDRRAAAAVDVLIQTSLDQAQGYADSYIGAVWLTPVVTASYPTTAALLQGMLLDVAAWFIFGGRNDVVSSGKQKCFDAWQKWLEMVAEGKIPLTGAILIPPTVGVTSGADWGVDDGDTIEEDGYRLMTRDGLGAL